MTDIEQAIKQIIEDRVATEIQIEWELKQGYARRDMGREANIIFDSKKIADLFREEVRGILEDLQSEFEDYHQSEAFVHHIGEVINRYLGESEKDGK